MVVRMCIVYRVFKYAAYDKHLCQVSTFAMPNFLYRSMLTLFAVSSTLKVLFMQVGHLWHNQPI